MYLAGLDDICMNDTIGDRDINTGLEVYQVRHVSRLTKLIHQPYQLSFPLMTHLWHQRRASL